MIPAPLPGSRRAPVAQLDRVLPSEGRGHRFESCRARHLDRGRACCPLWIPAKPGRNGQGYPEYESNGMDPSPHRRHRVPDWRCEATSHGMRRGRHEAYSPQYVIRGGLAKADNLIEYSGPVESYPGVTGFSVRTAPGMSPTQLALTAPTYPNKMISVTTVDALRNVGVPVVPTPNPTRGISNPLHATAVVSLPLDPERAAAISEVFSQMANPAICH